MNAKQKLPSELEDKALDAASTGSGEGYVVTHIAHTASASGSEVRHKLFAIVDRTQL